MYWNKDVWDRIKRYYLHTYVRLPEFGQQFLFVQEVCRDWVRLVDVEGNIVEVVLDNGYNMEYAIPANKISFQMDGNAYIYYRIPARQYLRGFSESNSRFQKVSSEGKLFNVELSWALLEKLGNKIPYMSISQALIAFKTKKYLSLALSHRWIITSKQKLLLNDKIVGILHNKNSTITCLPAYKCAVEELCNTMGETFNIQVKA